MVTKMMIEPNLFYEKGLIHARGHHDPVGKCLTLLAGSQGVVCSNPRSVFFGCPEIQKEYERNILNSTASAGNDTQYYLQKDVKCYATDNRDELDVAASLIAGALMKGDTLWRNKDGMSMRQIRSTLLIEAPVENSDEDIQRFNAAATRAFNILSADRDGMIDILSKAWHFKQILGTKNEDRFIIPRQVDHGIAKLFNLLCEEEEAYDLSIPTDGYTISDKMANDLFHQSTSKKVRSGIIKDNLQMSNTRSGQSSNNHQRPRFDCLLAMQYIPYLVCGIVPYHKIVSHFRHTDGGWVLKRVPIDHFQYILSPTETIPPQDISPDDKAEMENFAQLVKGEFFPKLLDKRPKKADTTPQIEVW